jgi:YD repeat-containing protein
VTDTRAGALGMSFEYDVEGRLSRAFQTGAPAQGARYGYDAFDRLASRTTTIGATTATTFYLHDLGDHIIAETDAAGRTQPRPALIRPASRATFSRTREKESRMRVW